MAGKTMIGSLQSWRRTSCHRLIVPPMMGLVLFLSTTNSVAPVLAQDPNTSNEALESLPALVRFSVQTIRPSLVTVESFGGVTTKQGEIGGIRKQGEGNTTGVIVRADGMVLTSRFNFATQPRVISVLTSDGQRHGAKLIAEDMTRNLALLQIDKKDDLVVPRWVPADRREVGRYAISAGVGYGDANPAVSVGVISALNRIFGRAIQTDANISPANYGGPLLDLEGRVYGICVPLSPQGISAVAGTEWYDSGIGFVIPVSGTEPWLERLLSGESIYPGSLGVTVAENEGGEGLKIHRVLKDFPASAAGLAKDDVLLKVNGQSLSSQADLLKIIRSSVAGQKIKLTYVKAETTEPELEIDIELARHPDSLPKSLIPGLPPLQELR